MMAATSDEEKQPLLQARAAERGAVTGREWMTRWILTISLLTNFLLWLQIFSPCSFEPPLGPLEQMNKETAVKPNAHWAQHAAMVAETLATYDCSGHGNVLIDTVQSNDSNQVVCECHACFTGPTCAESVSGCAARIDSGDPVVYEKFWKENAEAGTLVTPPWYRMSYSEGINFNTGMTEALEQQIRTLHKMVGNVVEEDKFLVVSSGSSNMLLNIVQTLLGQGEDISAVVSALPFYELYRRQTDAFGNRLFDWEGDAKTFQEKPGNSGRKAVEFVTYPNNPDFLHREPVLNGSNSHTIYDFAYYWPHMQAISRKFDEDIMVFTLSKVTGHAGTRIGWAFFKDLEIANAVKYTLAANNLGTSRDAIARATQLLKAVIAGYSIKKGPVPLNLPPIHYAKQGQIFHYGRAILSKRYKWLVDTISQSSRFSIGIHKPEYCSFFGEKLDPAPAYAWISCNREEDKDCYELLSENGIMTYPGKHYGVSNRYVRFSLLKRDSDYEILAKHLPKLVFG